MVLGSTQPLKEMNTRSIPGGKGRPARKSDNPTAICEPIIKKMCEPRRLTNLCLFTASYRDSFTFFIFIEANILLLLNELPTNTYKFFFYWEVCTGVKWNEEEKIEFKIVYTVIVLLVHNQIIKVFYVKDFCNGASSADGDVTGLCLQRMILTQWTIRDVCWTHDTSHKVMRRPVFDPRPGRVGFVVDKVTLRLLFSEYVGVLCKFLFHHLFHVHYLCYHWCYIISKVCSVVK
jgi:hypothetical protein